MLRSCPTRALHVPASRRARARCPTAHTVLPAMANPQACTTSGLKWCTGKEAIELLGPPEHREMKGLRWTPKPNILGGFPRWVQPARRGEEEGQRVNRRI